MQSTGQEAFLVLGLANAQIYAQADDGLLAGATPGGNTGEMIGANLLKVLLALRFAQTLTLFALALRQVAAGDAGRIPIARGLARLLFDKRRLATGQGEE
ncbi:hypothetical protein CCR95_19300 [Thiocystis minor]|uniref:hypothetical protein n=1 Tax=Thiocystis minor TaxID=61597 RepID=UPI0019136BF4|nr:hypothetical protein [Thiocystis minor]MBK5966168.1 hypothetical protein [Thiocystis minor]